MITTLFAYGTLMDEEIFQLVTGTLLPHHFAELNNYQRYHVVNEVYPGLIEMDGCRVKGCFYSRLSPEMWGRLDRFEGEMYIRKGVTVQAETGNVFADTYIFKPEYRHRLTSEVWDSEYFRENRERFLEEYRGFSKD